jgi:hypothetical protein
MSVIERAIALYRSLAPRHQLTGEVILSTATREAVCESLHASNPGWYKHFNLDQVEHFIFHNPTT